MNISRRNFMRATAGISAGVSAQIGSTASAPLALSLAGLAAAASSSSVHAADIGNGYRAVVCLFMNGGSDSHNWIVPIDRSGYMEYAATRRELAWATAKLSSIGNNGQSAGREFGLPTDLEPLRRLYANGSLAFVSNVGPLSRPLTKREYVSGAGIPSKLFSHNDQQSTWQSLSPEGARSGWGGRMGDILMSANQFPVFTTVSTSGNAVFLTGSSATAFQVGPEGPVTPRALGASWVHGSSTAGSILSKTLTATSGNPFQDEYARVVRRSLESTASLRTAMTASAAPNLSSRTFTASTGTSFDVANEPLAKQLQTVTSMIKAGQSLGMRRQVFMVQVGGFDSHANQMRDQPILMAKVAASVEYFFDALTAMGLHDKVLLFSASEFGRTLNSNGVGSDHGWGSHHFVAGGGVTGGRIYGEFPVTALNTETDVGSGRLLPTTSVSELAGAIGGWMGLSGTELRYMLPNLQNFSSASVRGLV